MMVIRCYLCREAQADGGMGAREPTHPSNIPNLTVGNLAMNNIGVIYDLQAHLLIRRGRCSAPKPTNRTRGCIIGFSERSGSRMRRYLRCCVSDYRVLITLTYPDEYPTDGRKVKKHLKCFLQWLKRQSGGDGFSAFWFLEFQARGAPHIHIFATDWIGYQLVARSWYDIVGSGDERHYRAGTRVEELRSGRRGMCKYASKYAAKQDQKGVPSGYENVGRFWGVCGNRETMAASIFVPVDLIDNPVVIAFRDALAKVMKEWRHRIKDQFSLGCTSMVFITSDEALREVRNVFRIFGPLLERAGCAYTYPERELNFEGHQYDIPFT